MTITESQIALAGILGTLLAGLIGPWVAARATAARDRKARLMEARLTLYAEVLERLYQLRAGTQVWVMSGDANDLHEPTAEELWALEARATVVASVEVRSAMVHAFQERGGLFRTFVESAIDPRSNEVADRLRRHDAVEGFTDRIALVERLIRAEMAD